MLTWSSSIGIGTTPAIPGSAPVSSTTRNPARRQLLAETSVRIPIAPTLLRYQMFSLRSRGSCALSSLTETVLRSTKPRCLTQLAMSEPECGVDRNTTPRVRSATDRHRTSPSRGVPQHLLDQQPAQAVRDEDQRPLAQAVDVEPAEDVGGAVGQGHAVPLPGGGGDLVAQQPDAHVRQVLAQPVGPGGAGQPRRLPGGAGVAVEAVDENDVAGAGGIVAAQDLDQLAHLRPSAPACAARSTRDKDTSSIYTGSACYLPGLICPDRDRVTFVVRGRELVVAPVSPGGQNNVTKPAA